jgi:hypothetical protein
VVYRQIKYRRIAEVSAHGSDVVAQKKRVIAYKTHFLSTSAPSHCL